METYNATTNGVKQTASNSYNSISVFYHVYVTFDASLTAADRLQVIINGVRDTSFSSSTDPAGNINTTTAITRLGRQGDGSYAANAYLYQPAFFSGVIPSVGSLRNGSLPKDLRGMSGLWSLLHSTASSTLEDDEIKAANWTNNNTVVKSAVVP